MSAYQFEVWLVEELYNPLQIYVEKIVMYLGAAPASWERIELHWNGQLKRWLISGDD